MNSKNSGLPSITVQIVHIEGPRRGQIDEFSEAQVSIGRDPSSRVAFPKDLRIVSRKHAVITREGNRFHLKNLSPNGTFVNGQSVEETYLKQGDVLTFAKGGPKASFLTTTTITTPGHKAPPPPPPTKMPPTKIKPPPPDFVQQHFSPGKKPVIPADQFGVAPFTIQYGTSIRSFKQGSVKLGKERTNHFILAHPRVFDVHAEIFHQNNQYYIRDLTNSHATLLNGKAVGYDSLLQENDVIEFSEGGPCLRYLGTGRFVELKKG